MRGIREKVCKIERMNERVCMCERVCEKNRKILSER